MINENREFSGNLRNTDVSKVIWQRTQVVRGATLFAGIPDEECASIVATAWDRSYPPGKTIFFEGDPVQQVVLLLSGSVKLSQCGVQGREAILRIVGPLETLCAECFPKFSHRSTAQTITASSALVWEAIKFEAVAQRYPAFGRNISCALLHTLNQLEVRFRELSTEKVGPRLSSQLLRLARQVGRPTNGHVEIKLSQRDLAQLTGTTLFTVSRLLGQWEALGAVRPLRQGIVVLDPAALEALADSE